MDIIEQARTKIRVYDEEQRRLHQSYKIALETEVSLAREGKILGDNRQSQQILAKILSMESLVTIMEQDGEG